MYKKWLQTKNVKDEVSYKNYRKLFKKIASEAEQLYFRQLFDSRSNSVRKLWHNLNSVCSFTNNTSKTQISKLCINNNVISDKKEICDCLNEYFCTVGQKLASNIPPMRDCSFSDFFTAAVKK